MGRQAVKGWLWMRERAQRIDVGRSITIELGSNKIEAKITNVSFGGILVQSDQRPHVGEIVKILDPDIGSTAGTVVRLTADGFALALGSTPEAAKLALNSITEEMLSDVLPADDEES